MKSKKL